MPWNQQAGKCVLWTNLCLKEEGFAVFYRGKTFFGEFSQVIVYEEVSTS
jgi:hypothetical protein